MKTAIEKAFGALILWLIVFLPLGYFIGWGLAFFALAIHSVITLTMLYIAAQKEAARNA